MYQPNLDADGARKDWFSAYMQSPVSSWMVTWLTDWENRRELTPRARTRIVITCIFSPVELAFGCVVNPKDTHLLVTGAVRLGDKQYGCASVIDSGVMKGHRPWTNPATQFRVTFAWTCKIKADSTCQIQTASCYILLSSDVGVRSPLEHKKRPKNPSG